MAHPPRSNPPLRSSSDPPRPCITPSTETFVFVVSFMVVLSLACCFYPEHTEVVLKNNRPVTENTRMPHPRAGRRRVARGVDELRRTILLRGSVNRGNCLDPTPHLCFVAQVLFAELPLQVPLLTLDDATLD